MKRQAILFMVVIILVALPSVVAKTAPTDVLQTIQPVVVSTSSAVAGCSSLDLNPGSAIFGSSGWIMASCLHGPAITLEGASETPSFALTLGWDGIVLQSQFFNSCSFPIVIQTLAGPRLSGSNMTSGQPIQFSTWTSTTLPLGGYNYCLHYSNPGLTGIAAFSVSWNP